MSVGNLAASIRDRLLNKARAERLDFNLLLTRYALERMLYRMSVSEGRDRFLLKGALLFDVWFDIPHRPTRDADFLAFGSPDIPQIEGLFRDICRIDGEDGIAFDPASVSAAEIRKEANYAGIRVTQTGLLDGARCSVQVDIGFGDAVVPGPEEIRYPLVLDGLPQPRLRAYPRYSVIAEKFEALASLGMANSRMKDYFDLWVLAQHADYDSAVLAQAIAATFERRRTPLPAGMPLGLSDEFVADAAKQKQWQAFLNKNAIAAIALAECVDELRRFLLPVLASGAGQTWRAGTGWASVRRDDGGGILEGTGV